MTLWARHGYRCILVVEDIVGWRGELQLLDRNDLLLQQRLKVSAEAVPLALAWERQYEPVFLACGRG